MNQNLYGNLSHNLIPSPTLFSKIVIRLAKVDLSVAMAIPALIGIAIAFAGIIIEADRQGVILAHGGASAIYAYNAARYAVPGDWCLNGLLGRFASLGINLYIRGVVFSVFAPLASAGALLLIRRSSAVSVH